MNSRPDSPDTHAALSLPAVLEEFPRLHAFLTDWAARIPLPEHPTGHLLIAADEIFTNITAYAYPAEPGDVEIRVAYDPAGRKITLTFLDRGVPFDPLAGPDPDITTPLAERPCGGLGIYVVKKMMDQVTYRRDHDRNILTMVKNLGDKEAPACG